MVVNTTRERNYAVLAQGVCKTFPQSRNRVLRDRGCEDGEGFCCPSYSL